MITYSGHEFQKFFTRCYLNRAILIDGVHEMLTKCSQAGVEVEFMEKSFREPGKM